MAIFVGELWEPVSLSWVQNPIQFSRLSLIADEADSARTKRANPSPQLFHRFHEPIRPLSTRSRV